MEKNHMFNMSPVIENIDTLQIEGEVLKKSDVSGISASGNWVVIGSDEGSHLQVLRRNKLGFQVKEPPVHLMDFGNAKDKEVDIEAITHDGHGTFYVLGSHSAKRKKVTEDRSYRNNRKRIQVVKQEKSRSNLFRLKFDFSSMSIEDTTSTDLDIIFEQDNILKLFNNIPSKENGIDLEGIAYREEQLFLGFRGPVLRENFVPVIVTTFNNIKDYEMRFVDLNGRGIRDLVAVSNGFLIVAGPVSKGDGRFYLHFWSGQDEIPGHDRVIEKNKCIGEIPTPHPEAKAEGITILEETEEHYRAIMVFDGVDLRELPVFRILKQNNIA
ncbi:DUF3616 domain-containing protein [Fulvivirgaceae bacterium BMA12]|uniref:DUF3616 domain-containing protein n=1 Tax=Agaribacillus aureus TaxID=3051825 RepID=A0ABT8L2C6_9BACT|nr:DUF3616 domain-containing protein [Fulvivirgaceae bacterium BMA12]